MEIINKSFKEWKQSELRRLFRLVYEEDLLTLTKWLEMPIELTPKEVTFLTDLLKDTKPFIDHWNETELRENFIIDLTKQVRFKDLKYNLFPFAERYLNKTIKVEDIEVKLSGHVDWMVAIGYETPELPLFFIHEYKSEEGKKLDGKGQLLAAMFAAQQLNKQLPIARFFEPKVINYKNKPIYGAYVVGKYWNFLVLDDKTYGISPSFDCTKEQDLQAIFKTLKAQKQIIYSYLEN